ncbi:hypothetical protein GFER_06805 [Geoalkalibacter ferrihydriticus DSM 17813]|uniref:Uncharacterized protein n=1 Tax=Geoalkalibacter ferrihydriticus DSM 17813 TaxID=1121915 RepID=A0A0C2HIF5_9BACT|nr:hypothetical protein GFER_06805 [Geoalkalibacter ferrihydriticus DSM 17813]
MRTKMSPWPSPTMAIPPWIWRAPSPPICFWPMCLCPVSTDTNSVKRSSPNPVWPISRCCCSLGPSSPSRRTRQGRPAPMTGLPSRLNLRPSLTGCRACWV